MTKTLKSALDQFRLEFTGKIPPEIAAAMARADNELAASGIAARALAAGAEAPDFTLKGAHGETVTLSKLLRHGPVVVSFYRGGWCPYCNLELRALQAVLPEITGRGATLVAISPELPDESLSTADKNELAFPVLSDTGSRVAREWGIAFDLAEELRPIYTRFGHALPDRNGGTSWVLPVPATFVISDCGIVRMAFVDTDYRNRLEPHAVLCALDGIAVARARMAAE
ncbi:peroxiredoxin-like family protein [Novosphingobium sp.]|uniref:peroxiredoxin-like family protein n=1 Tax=Novosphingobium sp. TaxID=1874826 RepID=UPI001DD1F5E8|nr:peroxiredoxin-like family protein [Novosphingobium sp.]MBX9665475.1 AhpC/TSA family protein [Novosphingobium sp.]